MNIISLFIILLNTKLASQEIKIPTDDGCILSAYQSIKSTGSYILIEVHGFGSVKEEWNKLNQQLDSEKINYISVDLRGHGKSVKCGKEKISYTLLLKPELKLFLKDIDAVYRHISKKIKKDKIIPIGASIGANIVMEYFYNKTSKIILMSPGLDYGGFKPQNYIENFKGKILFTASTSDNYSYESVKYFLTLCENKKINCSKIIAKAGHGVEIFNTSEGEKYIKDIISWIKN